MDSIDAECGVVARILGPDEEEDAEFGRQDGAAQFSLVETPGHRISANHLRLWKNGTRRCGPDRGKSELNARVPASCALPVRPDQLIVVDQDVVSVAVAVQEAVGRRLGGFPQLRGVVQDRSQEVRQRATRTRGLR